MQVGLITRERVGTSLRYGADLDGLREVTAALWTDCCRGRPDLCPPFALTRDIEERPMTAPHAIACCSSAPENSARSIFAEIDPAQADRRPVRGLFGRHAAAVGG